MTAFDDQRAWAIKMDSLDPLAEFRDNFYIDDPDTIYLDGNSLGRLPKQTQTVIQNIVGYQWGYR